MHLKLTKSEVSTLKELLEFGIIARKGNFLHQPHEADMRVMQELARKLGCDPDEWKPSDDR